MVLRLRAALILATLMLIAATAFPQSEVQKVQAKAASSPITQFVRVIAPNGGERFELGSFVEIRWELLIGDAIDSIRVRLIGSNEAVSSSQFPRTLATLTKISTSSWIWQSAGPTAEDLRIEVEVYSGKRIGIIDTSDRPFSIVQSKLHVLSPNGGEVLGETTTAAIEWSNPFLNGSPPPEGYFRILISRDGGLNYSALIADRIAVTESTFNWIVEAPPSIEARIKVLFAPASPMPDIIEDSSDGDFRIIAGIRKAKTEQHD